MERLPQKEESTINISVKEAEQILFTTKRERTNKIPNYFKTNVEKMIESKPEFSNVYLEANYVLWEAVKAEKKLESFIQSIINCIKDRIYKFHNIDLLSHKEHQKMVIQKGFTANVNRQLERDW